jgi:hypothetical protein
VFIDFGTGLAVAFTLLDREGKFAPAVLDEFDSVVGCENVGVAVDAVEREAIAPKRGRTIIRHGRLYYEQENIKGCAGCRADGVFRWDGDSTSS